MAPRLKKAMVGNWLSDVQVTFRKCGTIIKANAFLLSLISPVLERMLCGNFKESMTKCVDLVDVDAKAFDTMMRFACGCEDTKIKNVQDAIELGKTAARFEVLLVVRWVEQWMNRNLNIENCARMLMESERHGWCRVEDKSRQMALNCFEEFARTPDFMSLSEDMLQSLLEDQRLSYCGGERIFEALVDWMRGDGVGLRGEHLLRTIEFHVICEDYLAKKALSLLRSCHSVRELVQEAIKLAGEGAELLRPLLVPQMKTSDPWWSVYEDGAERRLRGHSGCITSVQECAGRVCSGSFDGTIRIWNKVTLKVERRLDVSTAVRALTEWKGYLISGDVEGRVKVWDARAGKCVAKIGHRRCCIFSLIAAGDLLVCGADDGTMSAWRLRKGCFSGDTPDSSDDDAEKNIVQVPFKLLKMHEGPIMGLVLWKGRVISGGCDGEGAFGVWCVQTGRIEKHGYGTTSGVTALVQQGKKLFAAFSNGAIAVYLVKSLWHIAAVQAYPATAQSQYIRCLTICGSKLIGGSRWPASDSKEAGEVKVWDCRTLRCEQTIKQPAGGEMRTLVRIGCEGGAAGPGEVWGGVGEDLVVWGREPGKGDDPEALAGLDCGCMPVQGYPEELLGDGWFP